MVNETRIGLVVIKTIRWDITEKSVVMDHHGVVSGEVIGNAMETGMVIVL